MSSEFKSVYYVYKNFLVMILNYGFYCNLLDWFIIVLSLFVVIYFVLLIFFVFIVIGNDSFARAIFVNKM